MIDATDKKILRILQKNGRAKRNEIAEKVGLSLPSLSERMRKLEEAGIIEGYFAKVNRKAFGYDIMAFIVVVMESSKNYSDLRKRAKRSPEILECHAILGEGSHIIKALVRNTAELEKLLSKIQSWPGVVRTITNFVLSNVKETTEINLGD
jgi:Lrp/AsnC family leucine-responsive transcriptional regulator